MTLEPNHNLLILLLLICVLLLFVPKLSSAYSNKSNFSHTIYTKDVPTFVHQFFKHISDIQKTCEATYDIWDEVAPCRQWRIKYLNSGK